VAEQAGRRVKLDVFHYSAYISQLARRQRWSDAVELWASMSKAGLKSNVCTYSALITAHESGGQWERARATFEEMKAAGLQSDRPTYTPLFSVLWKWDQRRTAIEHQNIGGGLVLFPG